MILALIIILIVNLTMKLLDLEEITIYTCFMMEIFFIGVTFNLLFMILEARINPKLLSCAMEFNSVFGNLSTMACPLIAKMAEPTPTLFVVILCLVGVAVMVWIPDPKNKEIDLQQTLEHTIVSMVNTINATDFYKGNQSSVVVD